jgi:uncharacterized protein YhdP
VQRLAWPRRAATVVGALLLGLVATLALTWVVVDAAIVPRIDTWRPEVERHASEALGVKVRVGRLSAQASGVLPRIALHDVRLLDEQGRAALVLGRIDARLSPLALLQGLLWQEAPAARLAVHTPELQVRRDRAGTWWVGGLALRPRAGGDAGAALDWLFSQRALMLAGGRVVWTDEARGAPPLALEAVEIRLRNRGGLFAREHEMSLRAVPPADWGGAVSLAGRFSQPRLAVWTPARPGPQGQRAGLGRTRASDLRTWSGKATLALPRADMAVLRRHLPLPAGLARTVPSARGALAADLRWHRGALSGVTADLGLQDVELRLGESLPPLRLPRLAGRLALEAGEAGGRLQAEGLSFALADAGAEGARTVEASEARGAGVAGAPGLMQGAAAPGARGSSASGASHQAAAPTPPVTAPPAGQPAATVLTWAPSRLALSWRAPPQPPAPGSAASWAPGLRWDAARGGSLVADRLDLAVLDALARRLPLPAEARAHLASLAPRGLVRDLDLRWDGPIDAPQRYTARGSVEALSVRAREARALAAAGSSPLAGPGSGAVAPAADVGQGRLPASAASPSPALRPSPVRAPSPDPHPHPLPGRPGVEGASVRFDATEKGGQAELSIRQGALTFPGVFEAPRIPLRELRARLSWTLQRRAGQPVAVELRARQVRLANEDLQGELQATWRTGDPARRVQGRGAWLPGHLDLEGRLSQGRATAVARYLPQSLPAHTRHYVRDAVQGGLLEDVRFAVRGDLWDVPYPRGGGRFLIRGQVRGATLAYGPPAQPVAAPVEAAATGAPARPSALGWPVFTDLHGELVFEQQSMAIRGARARLGTVGAGRFELTGVEGRIADLAHSTLVIDGRGRGPLDDLLQYLRSTPLGAWTGQALAEARGSGPAELTLSLKLPLARMDDATVRGSVRLPGNELVLLPGAPRLSQLRGDIGFTERGVQVRTSGRALGGELRIDGGSQADGSQRFTAQGSLTADGLRRALQGLDEPGTAGPAAPSATAGTPAARLASRLSGQTTARLQLAFVGGQAQWSITSNLVGLGLDLPAPLGKRPEQPLPLRIQLAPLAGTPVAAAPAAAAVSAAPAARRPGAGADKGPVARPDGAPGGQARAEQSAPAMQAARDPHARDLPAARHAAAPDVQAARHAAAPDVQAAPSARDAAVRDPHAARDLLRIELGQLLQAHYHLRPPGASQRVVRGAIGLLQPPRLPAAGVEAMAHLPRLDVAAWRAVWQPSSPAAAPAAQSAPVRGAPWPGTPASAATAGSPGAYIEARPDGARRPPPPGVLPRLQAAGPATSGAGGLPAPAGTPAQAPETAGAQTAARDQTAARAQPPATPAALSAPAAVAPAASAAPATAAPAAPPASPLSTALAGFLPQRLQLRTPQLDLGSRTLHDVTLLLSRAPESPAWRAQVAADQVEGTVDVADDGSRISARLSRLTIPADDPAEGGARPAAANPLPDEPASVPALDIVAEQFDWRGLKLGRLEVRADHTRDDARAGGPRPWRLSRLELVNPHARLSASGTWLPARAGGAPGGRATELDFTLELADSGALLGRLGWPQTVRGGKGRLVGKIAWPGSPLAAGTAGLDGTLRIELASGQFLKAEPGAARLLGVLSLQSLPRRLLLDFRDVFQQGFAFDRIDGDVVLDNGVARTRNLRMKGLQAVVLMEGSADLNRETQDLNVWVVPEINAGAASLAYAAVNPAIGLGTFVAQYLLRKPLAEANTREFRVTGSWADPQVERVARGQLQPGAALADGAQPGPAAPTGGHQADLSPADRRPDEPGLGDRNPAERIQAERNPAPRAPAAAQAAAAASVPR